MMRDELIMQLIALPADTPIGVQMGDQHLDVVRLKAWGDEGFVDLQCHSSDLLDVLIEWNLPADQREKIIAAAHNLSPFEGRSIITELLTAQGTMNLQQEPGRWLLPGTPP